MTRMFCKWEVYSLHSWSLSFLAVAGFTILLYDHILTVRQFIFPSELSVEIFSIVKPRGVIIIVRFFPNVIEHSPTGGHNMAVAIVRSCLDHLPIGMVKRLNILPVWKLTGHPESLHCVRSSGLMACVLSSTESPLQPFDADRWHIWSVHGPVHTNLTLILMVVRVLRSSRWFGNGTFLTSQYQTTSHFSSSSVRCGPAYRVS